MTPQNPTGQDPAALAILSSFALAHALFSAHSLGFFAPFDSSSGGDAEAVLDVDEAARREGWNPRIARGLGELLARRGVLVPVVPPALDSAQESAQYRLGPLGEHLVRDGWLGYILYYVGGYGDVLRATAPLARREVTYGTDLLRDIGWVALGTEMMSRTPHHRSYSAVLDAATARRPRNVLDIGCGTAAFLLQLAEASGASQAVGVDVSAGACDLARERVRQAAPAAAVDIVEGDFGALTEDLLARYGGFDVITSMMVVHEFLFSGREAVVAVLRGVARLLTPEGRFLLLEKATDALVDAPLYFTEFKFAHDLTNQDLCTLETWKSLLAEAGLEVVALLELPRHTGSVLFECGRRA